MEHLHLKINVRCFSELRLTGGGGSAGRAPGSTCAGGVQAWPGARAVGGASASRKCPPGPPPSAEAAGTY
jgi:hypothetical protein